MKSIDLKTTQNVSITYELASLRERFFAFLLDWIFKSIATGLLTLLFGILTDFDSDLMQLFVFVVVFPIITFYTLFFEMRFNGQTPGKMLMKIKVIKLNGKQPTFYDYLLRWSFRIVDLYITGTLVGCFMISSTKYSQRLGDMLSNSSVVRMSNSLSISLRDILRIDSKKSYVPVYPQIKNFREDDIILIKQVLDRFLKYKNDAHHDVMVDLTRIMAEKLELNSVPSDNVSFLRTLIKDYIVLTR